VFDPHTPFDAWSDIGIKIARHASGALWWLGDWLLFGRETYGRRYRLAVEATGLDAHTLRNYAVVARRFEPRRRRETLSFQHHAELCAFRDEEQDRWLTLAETGNWSRNELRRRLRAEAVAKARDEAERVSLQAPHQRVERWRRAAEREALRLEQWIVQTLNDAAGAVLETRDRVDDQLEHDEETTGSDGRNGPPADGAARTGIPLALQATDVH
jgi:hypothetical protein